MPFASRAIIAASQFSAAAFRLNIAGQKSI